MIHHEIVRHSSYHLRTKVHPNSGGQPCMYAYVLPLDIGLFKTLWARFTSIFSGSSRTERSQNSAQLPRHPSPYCCIMWSVDGSVVAPVIRLIRSSRCGLMFCMTATECSQSNSWALLATALPTRIMVGERDIIFSTRIVRYLSSCSINVSNDVIRASERWKSIPPANNNILGF